MMTRSRSYKVCLLSALGLVAAGLGTNVVAAAEAPPSFERLFSLVGDYPLGSATSRVDYESFDPTSGRLFIAKMGAGKLLVFDTARNQLFEELPGFPKTTGVLAVPQLHRVYVSVPGAGLKASLSVGLGMAGLSSGSGALAVMDTTDLHEVARLPGGVFPDGITYDPVRSHVFVSDELGSAVLVYNAADNRPLGRIAAGGEVGNARYDARTDRIYVPVQSRDRLAVIDPESLRLLATVPLPGASHPHGLIIAPAAAIGYVSCDGNDRMLTVSLPEGKVLSTARIGHDPDVLAIDEKLKRLYIASESGVMSSFDISDPATPTPLGDVMVGDGAHSVAVDPETHRLFFDLAKSGSQSVLRVLMPKS